MQNRRLYISLSAMMIGVFLNLYLNSAPSAYHQYGSLGCMYVSPVTLATKVVSHSKVPLKAHHLVEIYLCRSFTSPLINLNTSIAFLGVVFCKSSYVDSGSALKLIGSGFYKYYKFLFRLNPF